MTPRDNAGVSAHCQIPGGVRPLSTFLYLRGLTSASFDCRSEMVVRADAPLMRPFQRIWWHHLNVQNSRSDASGSAWELLQPPAFFRTFALQLANSQAARLYLLISLCLGSCLWPRYSCSEHDGVGWSAEAISEQNGRLEVRFLHARTVDGRTWPTVPQLALRGCHQGRC